MKNVKIKYSFAEWCRDNNHQDWLDRWDYELNGVGPEEAAYRSNKRYWFKCPMGLHESECGILSDLCIRKTPFVCKQCNSLGQHLVNTFGCDAIEKYWSEKNDINPFCVAKFSNKKYFFKCPDCGSIKYATAYDWVVSPFSCKKCGGGNSYPNKFMREFLLQLETMYKLKVFPEHVFQWSENIDENTKRRIYDFVINEDDSIIIEVHGIQHYEHGFCDFDGGKTLDEELLNDVYKRTLALQNGIRPENYIVIDARYSDPVWIKNSILQSKLSNIYHFSESDINWLKCNEVACKSAVRTVCDLYMSGITSIMELSAISGYCKKTIHKYLKLGVNNGWCDYSEEYRRCSTMRPLQCVENGCVFASRSVCSSVSESIFGEKLSAWNIGTHIISGKPTSKGWHFIDITKEYFIDIQNKNPNIAFGVLH